jgi:hypothetical protein
VIRENLARLEAAAAGIQPTRRGRQVSDTNLVTLTATT